MKTLKLLILLILVTSYGMAQYNKKMIKAIKKSIGSDLKGYQCYSYPTNNYGLITSYFDKVNKKDFICDTWFCIGYENLPTDAKELLSIKEFAAVGHGGSIDLTEEDKKKFAVDAALPKLYEVLKIEGGFKSETVTNTTLTIGKAYIRTLRRDKIIAYINSLPTSASLKEAYLQGRMVITVSDVVIQDLVVTISLKKDNTAALDAKVGAGNTPTVFDDAGVKFSFQRNSEGVYTFKIAQPVVFAVMTKKQPGAGVYGNKKNFDDWKTVSDLPDPSKIK